MLAVAVAACAQPLQACCRRFAVHLRSLNPNTISHLYADMQVWMWGEPWGEFSMTVDRRPRPVKGAHNIAKIQCGAFHNLALSRYGALVLAVHSPDEYSHLVKSSHGCLL